ncbi:MAG TPA: efflux RND transporter periplasmic adaptor subunit [Burkholderiales bacterium]|nr:efflux RND transporter periplasmic adaptor subunit [Burkholderiales bacterium]
MRRSLFSPLWYRVAGQHPRLPPGVRAERQTSRGESWYLLIDGASGRHFRVNDKAYQFVGRCDGTRTVQEIWDSLFGLLRDDAPTQDEIIALLARLDENGLIITEAVPDTETLFERAQQRRRQRRRGFVNPFAFRISLGDPWPLLERFERVSAALFHPLTFAIWIFTVAAACAMAAANWDALSAHGSTYLGTAPYVFLTWLSFPFIKALHELCHALAVQRWGGEVHETGITLFVLVPAPYVDASQSTGFRARYQRVLVGAAGVMCETFIAACALFVWLNVEPGMVRNLAFVTLVTASVSTLLFNGNPLLKFDAYYVACDLLDMPNLAPRSAAWWSERIRRLLGGPASATLASPAAGEVKWLALYSPLSAAYRLFISLLIVLWIGAQSAVLGFAAAVFLVVTIVMKPLAAACRRLLASLPPGAARMRGRGALMAGAAGVAAFVCLVPLPLQTAALGVVWLPDRAHVRPHTEGFVSTVLARDGEPVRSGMVLVRLDDPALHAARVQLARRREELEVDRYAAIAKRDLAQVQIIDQDIARTEEELKRTSQKIANLEVRSGADGMLVMPRQQDLPGSFARRGANLGYVLNREDVVVRAAVREDDVALVRERTLRVGVRIAGDYDTELPAELVRNVPAATRELPSAALGERGGGPYAIDPTDKDGLQAIDPVVLIDLRVPAAALERVGARAWVVFDHGAEPLASQLYRRTRQLLLRHFNPSGA